MWWPLMQSAITESDKQALINFISTSDTHVVQRLSNLKMNGVSGLVVNTPSLSHLGVQQTFYSWRL